MISSAMLFGTCSYEWNCIVDVARPFGEEARDIHVERGRPHEDERVPHPPEPPRAFYESHRATTRQNVRPPKGTPPAQPYIGAEAAFLVEYLDGLRVTVLMLAGYAEQWGAAVRVRGHDDPLAYSFIQDRSRSHSNFSHLSFMVEEHILHGRSPYPVERTLLASGLIDAAMTSHYEDGRRIDTPYLNIQYAPPDAPNA